MENIENARHKSYKFFPVKKKVTLIFETDNRISMIDGYVENNDPNIFSATEGTQISIICPDPYFKSLNPEETVFSGTESLFEFPFESALPDELIEFSNINDTNLKSFDYYGDEDTGFTGTAVFSGSVSGFSIHDVDTNEVFSLDDDVIASITEQPAGFVYGDVLMISSVRGNKYVRLYRNTTEYNILNAMTTESVWPVIKKGKNTFAFTTTGGGVEYVEFTIQNKVLWDGV